MKISTIVLIVFTMSSMGLGQAKQKKIKMHKNPKAMKQEIAKLIAIGSSIAEAQRIMEANKFGCELRKGGGITTGTEDKPDREYKNIDFLYCGTIRHALAGFLDPRRLTCMRMWNLAIVEKDGVVSDILVYVGWYCEL
jgi:hypothetical protein